MTYALEHPDEFERLERQSALPILDYKRELEGVAVKDGARVLDAGCGSGIVSRYLAEQFPHAQVVGCDYTASLIAKATEKASGIENLRLLEENLLRLSFEDGAFDLIVCRFVLHLQAADGQKQVIAELARVLKTGGKIVVIDNDGLIVNLHPQTAAVHEGLRRLSTTSEVDLFVGRKIPALLSNAGLGLISWKIETLEFQGEAKQTRLEMMRDKFTNASDFFQRIVGEGWDAFQNEYIECLERSDSVCFHNKFIAIAEKTT